MDELDSQRLIRRFSHVTSPERLARAFVVLVCISVIGMTGWRVYVARHHALAESRVTTSNLAGSLADQAHATMRATDVLLSEVIERLEVDGTSATQLARLGNLLTSRVASIPTLRDVIVYSATGVRLLDSTGFQGNAANNSDREYFAYHRTHADETTFISPPMRSRATGRWTLAISRRLHAPDGGFGGVVVAAMDIEKISELYATFDVGPHGSVSLLTQDGTVLVRVPQAPGYIGTNLGESPLFRSAIRSGPVGSAEVVSALDGVTRLNSFQKVPDYNLVVFVARSKADVLASWYSDAFTGLAIASIVSFLLGLLGWHLAGQIRRRHRAELAVCQSERQYRLLADSSTDLIVQLGADNTLVYVSPASEPLLGCKPEELLGQAALTLVHPDDRPAIAGHLAAAPRSGQAPLSFRMQRKDGTYLWAEALGRRLDKGLGAVVAIRDVTRRKHAEDRLHQANNQLQKMVMLDGLTGISNRRCFDTVLKKEFRRAARTETPLALLLIDVDHFKHFNDAHGHPAGDACLRTIAATIDRQIRRPADLAARYGGEEFGVILPTTDAEGALTVAEWIRNAIRGLEMPHPGGVGDIVTVSIGVAVIWPRHETSTELSLIESADAALYQAKARGRDYVCLAGTQRATFEQLMPNLSKITAAEPAP